LLRPYEVLRYFLRLPVEQRYNSDNFVGPNLYPDCVVHGQAYEPALQETVLGLLHEHAFACECCRRFVGAWRAEVSLVQCWGDRP
jgi:hypothetical protein